MEYKLQTKNSYSQKESKTPKFDRLLDDILEKIVPHTRSCAWKGEHEYCEGDFNITEEDIKFLKILRVPAPNYCPTCRRIRRLSHMNHSRLFKHRCLAPDHQEMIISIFPEECPFPVYDYHYFTSDEFDPFSFGIDYKNGDDPMNILYSLRKIFPMPSFLNRDPSSVNSEYSNGGRDTKNAYYSFGSYHSEDVWYSGLVIDSHDIMDFRGAEHSSLCYEGVFSDHLYKSCFIYFSSNCTDSMFLFDCRNCTNCFGCVNLRNKSYCIYNEQLTREKYNLFMSSIYPLSHEKISNYEKKFWDFVKSLPVNAERNMSSNNVTGVNLVNCKNLHDAIWAKNSEDCRHVAGLHSHNNSMDVLFSGGHSSLLYMNTNIGSHSNRVKFSISSKYCEDSEFIFNSKNLSKCFMCLGLQNKQYCILNKQYSEEEYFKLVDDIKCDMLKLGQYSDGLGFEFSAQSYNFSIAQIAYPLKSETIIKLGGYIAKDPETNISDIEVIKFDALPKTIEEISDDILNKAIICEISGKPFRIIASELEFYRRMNLPIPSIHPTLRLEQKLKFIKDGRKYSSVCVKCKKNIETMFDPIEKFLFYCSDCYKQEVY